MTESSLWRTSPARSHIEELDIPARVVSTADGLLRIHLYMHNKSSVGGQGRQILRSKISLDSR